MYKKVKMNYMKLVLPVAAALLVLAFVLLLVTGFGIRYGLMTSIPVENIPGDELLGSCAQIRTAQIEGTFARSGHITQEEADEQGMDIDIIQRFCMVKLDDGTYLGVRIGGEEELYKVEKLAAAIEEFGLEEATTMDFGVMRGTVNEMPEELYTIFCSWADEYASNDLAGKEYEDVLRPLMLDVNYYGPFTQGLTIAITVIAIVLAVIALALLISSFTGLWDKPIRAEMKKVGKAKLEEEFKNAEAFAGRLYLGKEHIWCFQKIATDIFKTSDVIWAYARSRRLEGGKLTWYFVMKTIDKREYSVHLGEAATVKAAEDKLKAMVKPLCTGFDKEKQKLYEKDISTFRAKTKNGTI